MKRVPSRFLGLVLLVPFYSWASEWQFNGFVGQGYIAADDTQFVVGEDGSTFNITEGAFAVSWKPIEHIRIASALSYRQWGSLAEGGVNFDYLFVEYSHQVGEGMLGIRAGRFKNETGFYSSTRDVPFTRPSIMLPQSIYSDYFRDAQLHIEGADLFGMHQIWNGALDWHVSVGKVDVTEDLDRNVLGSHKLGSFESDRYCAADIEFQNDSLRLGITYYDAEISYHPSRLADYYPGEIRMQNWVFSGQFRYMNFEFTTEYMTGERLINGLIFPSMADELVDNGIGYYFDFRAYLPHEVELFVRLDKHIDDADSKDFEVITGLPAYFSYTDDWTLGARWFLNNDWLLAAEYHWVEGASWVTPILVPDPSTQSKHWSMFALQLSYRFQW